jgi:CRP/FNR family transcriptional regulator, dissimilatory nitrate respiration regulator
VIKLKIEEHIHIINASGLFKGFSRKDLLDAFDEGRYLISQYKKGSIIHLEKQKCVSLDLILKGEVSVQEIDEKGNTLIITEFKASDNMGGNLIFSKYPYYPMSVLAKNDVLMLHIDRSFVLKLCQQNMDFLLEFLSCISDKTAILTNKIKSISMKSIRECVVDFLNRQYIIQKSNTIKLGISKKELAERLGIQRTSLSRELNKMKREGLISYDSRTITIDDFAVIKNSDA